MKLNDMGEFELVIGKDDAFELKLLIEHLAKRPTWFPHEGEYAIRMLEGDRAKWLSVLEKIQSQIK